jgi:hypothetical protein
MFISWYMTFSAYCLLAEDGRTACIGDGVDLFTAEDDSPIAPGTPEFADCMNALCAAPHTAEAYFPEPPAALPLCPICGSRNFASLDTEGLDWQCRDCGELFLADLDDSDCSPSGPIG